ncbi:MAG TPA: hypothetical protein VIY69_06465 [Candidatus Acidoferrales bacterium]
MATSVNVRTAAARGFVRSLNILLKFARMYDFGHPRTAKQYETAWQELRTALGSEDRSGLLLAVSGDQLLLDGTPLESAAAEKSFARMLSSAGIASIHFAPNIPQTSLAKFVRGFPSGNSSKPTHVAEQLKIALQGDTFIHVNEVCFVPADSAVAKGTVAAQLAARTLGMNSTETDELFKDPEKLLQLIVAAEGTKNNGRGNGEGSGGPGSGGPGNGGPGGGAGYGNGGWGGPGGGGTGTGGGTGSGVGPGYGAGPGDAGPGGGNGSGCGSVYGGGAIEGPASFQGTGGPAGPGVIGGNSGWNIVGGSGNGTPIDPNAGGFWLKKKQDGSTEQTTAGQGAQGGSLSGPGAGVGGQGGVSGWNIVGGNAGGAQVDPNAGGFWLNKQGAPQGGGEGGDGLGGPASGIGAGGQNGGGNGGGSAYSGVATDFVPGGEHLSRWTSASAGIRSNRRGRGGPGSMTVETGLMTLQEQELQGILQVLAQIARTSDNPKEKLDPGAFQSRLSTLPRRARFTVSQALAALAAQAPAQASDKPTLLKLAEHVAVRFALESYERGDVKVNAVREMLGDMSAELDGLRKILGVYEERMGQAGIEVQTHIEVLAQEFWAQVPDERRKKVLEGADAWCVPGSKVREHVDALRGRGENEQADKVLSHYASFISDKTVEHRRQVAMGLAELAATYANSDEKLFVDTIRLVGLQLAEETDAELQSLMNAAFVRLSQEAGAKRSFTAMQRSVEMMDFVEAGRPGAGKSLRPRVGVDARLPEFIEDALKTGEVPKPLIDFLRRIPEAATENIAARFSRSGFREDCELLLSMIESLGPEALEHLRHQLRHGNSHESIDTVGILARLDMETLQDALPGLLLDWKRISHDRLVRQIAASGASGRGRLLTDLFDRLDPIIRPLAIDEIGMSGERSADTRLLRIAEGDIPKDSTIYLQLKAMEALGRLRTTGASTVLRRIIEARRTWRWAYPGELRIVAAQALEKLDPEWVRSFMPKSGLSASELSIEPLDVDPSSSATRQRRYPRLRLDQPVPGLTINLKENCRIEVPEMALSGGIALSEQSLHPGSVVDLKLNAGQKQVRAQTIIRDTNTQVRAFEVIDMDLEERAKLRTLLVQLGYAPKEAKPQDRNRRGPRTLYNNNQG